MRLWRNYTKEANQKLKIINDLKKEIGIKRMLGEVSGVDRLSNELDKTIKEFEIILKQLCKNINKIMKEVK